MVPPDSGSCLNPSAPVRISQSHCSCSCSYSLCAQICLLRWGKKDGAINVSFKRRIVLPCALFQFPSVSFAKTLLPWNSRRSFFFPTSFFVPIPTLPLQPTLWHFCVFCGVLHFVDCSQSKCQQEVQRKPHFSVCVRERARVAGSYLSLRLCQTKCKSNNCRWNMYTRP